MTAAEENNATENRRSPGIRWLDSGQFVRVRIYVAIATIRPGSFAFIAQHSTDTDRDRKAYTSRT